MAQLSITMTLCTPGNGESWGAYGHMFSFKHYAIENVKTYKIIVKKLHKVFLVYWILKYIKCNNLITSKSREDRVSLTSNECCPTNASISQQCPSCCTLIGLVINAQFIQPDKIFCGNISIFCLPCSLQHLISLSCLFCQLLVSQCQSSKCSGDGCNRSFHIPHRQEWFLQFIQIEGRICTLGHYYSACKGSPCPIVTGSPEVLDALA